MGIEADLKAVAEVVVRDNKPQAVLHFSKTAADMLVDQLSDDFPDLNIVLRAGNLYIMPPKE